MCAVRLENPGVIYESDGTGQEYYGKAILCDAEGREVLTVENTRVNATGSQIAFTTRSQTMEFANLYIAYKSQDAEGSRVETLLSGTAAEVDYTPDQRLVTTLNMGKAPAYTGEETTAADTEAPTAPSDGTGIAPNDTQPAGKKGCKSILALPALIPLLAAGLLLRRREDPTGN